MQLSFGVDVMNTSNLYPKLNWHDFFESGNITIRVFGEMVAGNIAKDALQVCRNAMSLPELFQLTSLPSSVSLLLTRGAFDFQQSCGLPQKKRRQ